jgi:hypothetical protein
LKELKAKPVVTQRSKIRGRIPARRRAIPPTSGRNEVAAITLPSNKWTAIVKLIVTPTAHRKRINAAAHIAIRINVRAHANHANEMRGE